MDIDEIKETIERCLDVKLVPFIQGSPGIGKSDIVKEIAEQRKLELIDLRLSQSDITDFNGLPKLGSEKAEFLPFDTFPLESDKLPNNKEGWLLFLDELNSANKSVQCASYKLILDRKIGNNKLNDKVYIVTAGNLITDNAIVYQLPSTLRSRLVNLVLEPDTYKWITWALNNDIDYRILSYIRYKPKNLFIFNPSKNDSTFACPRTWHMLSKLIKNVNNLSDYEEMVRGVVGSICNEFIEFTKLTESLPNIDDIIQIKCEIPDKIGIKWMTLFHIIQNIDKIAVSDLEKVVNYIKKMGDEYVMIFTKQLESKDKKRLMSNKNVVNCIYDSFKDEK